MYIALVVEDSNSLGRKRVFAAALLLCIISDARIEMSVYSLVPHKGVEDLIVEVFALQVTIPLCKYHNIIFAGIVKASRLAQQPFHGAPDVSARACQCLDISVKVKEPHVIQLP